MRRLLPTDSWVRFALVPALVFIAMAGDRNYLADFWHHLARGREIVAQGSLLDRDIFTYTVPGQPFQDVNWLSQVVYYGLFELGGLALVQVANALLLALTLALLINICRQRSGSLVVAMIVGIITFLGLWQAMTIRPQTFSLLLFVVLFDLLERSSTKPWLLLFPPLLLALWVNLHGAFPAGLMLVGAYFLAACWQKWKPTPSPQASLRARGVPERPRDPRRLEDSPAGLAACLGACLVATLANPYGWSIYGYVSLTSSRAAARRIDEWVPPNLDLWIGRAFFASLILLAVLVVLAWRTRKPGFRDWVLLALFLPLACGSVRMVTWWLIVLAPVLAELLAAVLPAAKRDAAAPRPNAGAGLVFTALLAVAVSSVPGLQSYNPLLAYRPQERIEHDLDAVHVRLERTLPSGRLFARLEWGEYLGWIGMPRHQVFMDGRIEIFPDEVWREYSTITLGRDGWEEILDRYQVDALILDADYHGRTGLLDAVTKSPQWQLAFQARSAQLYLRTH
ncbi:MAG: hypothetical protein HY040_05955 [Planctomycetes bacterium]|nr:hypothetical protein [Planctomycetota bacterium]